METRKQLMVQIPPELHRKLKIKCAEENTTMQKWLIEKINYYLN